MAVVMTAGGGDCSNGSSARRRQSMAEAVKELPFLRLSSNLPAAGERAKTAAGERAKTATGEGRGREGEDGSAQSKQQ